ncbi:MAG: polysaccharide pyruvyl transferase CsaB [Elusimicrobiota bacterium]|nr:polysaccharide pyruvyl transferase CsaB [Elusimicrobiota bacterium]
MKKVLLCGYFGFNNAGDELILESITELLKSENKELEIVVLSKNPMSTATMYNVSSVNRWNPISVIRAIVRSKIVISSGGLFQDLTGTISLYYYLALIVIGKLLGKKIVLYGVEFAPVRYRFNRYLLKKILPIVDRIAVRSEGSREFLKKLNIRNNVVLSADAIIGFYKVESKNQCDKIKTIGVVLKETTKDELVENSYVDLCNILMRRFQAELLFIPFHLERDLKLSVRVAQKLSSPVRIGRWNKPKDLLALIREVDFLISQRLHALIIGAMFQIPMLSLSNDPKLMYFFSECGQKHLTLDKFNSDVIAETITDIWSWKEKFRKILKENLPKLKYRSYLNLSTVSELL